MPPYDALLWYHFSSLFSSSNLTPFPFSCLSCFPLRHSFCYFSSRRLSKEGSPLHHPESWNLNLPRFSFEDWGCTDMPWIPCTSLTCQKWPLPCLQPPAPTPVPQWELPALPEKRQEGQSPRSRPYSECIAQGQLVLIHMERSSFIEETNLYSEEQALKHWKYSICQSLSIAGWDCSRLYTAPQVGSQQWPFHLNKQHLKV